MMKYLAMIAIFAGALFAIVLLPFKATPQFGELVEAEILPGWQREDGARIAGLRLTLAPGWKTYWRSPGDGGIPPQFAWNGSRNLSGVDVLFPTPSISTSYGLRTVGYSEQVVLPLVVSPKVAGRAVDLRIRLDMGVCEEVCVPISLDVSERLVGNGASDINIQTALAALPRSAKRSGVKDVSCAISPTEEGVRLDVQIQMPRLGGQEVVLIETADPRNWVSPAKVKRSGRTLSAVADIVPPPGSALALNRAGLRFTVIGSANSVEVRGC